MFYDWSLKAGGKQCIETLDGYIIPLSIRSGLPYMSIRPYTDKEWETLPHVILTADGDWDPSILDGDHNDIDDWNDVAPNIPCKETNPLFDDEGNYLHANKVVKMIMSNSAIMEEDAIKDLEIIATQTHSKNPDIEKYISKLGWAPPDVIKATFNNTTQFYTTPMGSNLKKRFKSPFPACNVHCRAEPVATDTVFSDTLAFDSGHDAAQIFVGAESLICDVYSIRSENQIINSLLDNIHE